MRRLALAAVGAWGPGFRDWPSLRQRLLAPDHHPPAPAPPPSLLIPSHERRRAPPIVRLALEAAQQAVAGLEARRLRTVFASGMGDTRITDYLCRTLSCSPTTLSPTQFHNSVHNAPSGYWSIATTNHSASNSVSAFRDTFAAAFLETATTVAADRAPVLMVIADIATCAPMDAICEIRGDLGISLLLSPPEADAPLLDWRVEAIETGDLCPVPFADLEGNPAAQALALLGRLARDERDALFLRLGAGTVLSIALAG